jgi:hypothetical protein
MKLVIYSPHYGYDRNKINTIVSDKIAKEFANNYIDLIYTGCFKTMEKNIFKVKPNILFLHFHDENHNTNNIIKLSKSVRREIQNCIIIITYIDIVSLLDVLPMYTYDVITSAHFFDIGISNFLQLCKKYNLHNNRDEIIAKLNALSINQFLVKYL